MTAPAAHFITLPAGQFRFLEWNGGAPATVFLHGLSGVAEVWSETVEAFGDAGPRSIALDQRGHGHSPKPPSGYGIGHYVEDAAVFVRMLKAGPVHLVGHSMGARVAIVLAARHPDLLRSVTIVDIGPEIWKENATNTIAAFESDAGDLSQSRRGAGLPLEPRPFVGSHGAWIRTRNLERRLTTGRHLYVASGRSRRWVVRMAGQISTRSNNRWPCKGRVTTGPNGAQFVSRRCSSGEA